MTQYHKFYLYKRYFDFSSIAYFNWKLEVIPTSQNFEHQHFQSTDRDSEYILNSEESTSFLLSQKEMVWVGKVL